MSKFLLPFVAILLLFSSCDSIIQYDVIIDNPSFDDLTVVVDDKPFEVFGYDYMDGKFSRGAHQVTATNADGEVVFDEEVDITGDGILNVTGATYVVWTDLYYENEAMYDVYAASGLNLKEVVEINGKEYNDVDLEVYENESFIEEDWDIDLNDYWPDEVSTSNDYAVRSKVYRVDKLEEDWGYWGDYDYSDYEQEDIDGLLDSLQDLLESMEGGDYIEEAE